MHTARDLHTEPSLASDGVHYGIEHHKRFAELFLEKFASKLKWSVGKVEPNSILFLPELEVLVVYDMHIEPTAMLLHDAICVYGPYRYPIIVW